MKKYSYDVILYTKIGKRLGQLDISVSNGIVKGVLNLLQKKEKVQGVVDESGVCSLQGKISTLLNDMAFVATGKMLAEKIVLTLTSAGQTFRLEGLNKALRVN